MDYRALAELVMLSLFGLSTLIFAAGLSIRLFLAPTLRELLGRRGNQLDARDKQLEAHLLRVEERLDLIEGSLDRLTSADEFDRQLKGPKLS
ncbi:MAG: hypothetical protein HKN73_20950 [Gemmatimonadetes bacterium]|nr:hypothetical protein [Gemmatimonadota bacterium]